jgi:hypothetical protein
MALDTRTVAYADRQLRHLLREATWLKAEIKRAPGLDDPSGFAAFRVRFGHGGSTDVLIAGLPRIPRVGTYLFVDGVGASWRVAVRLLRLGVRLGLHKSEYRTPESAAARTYRTLLYELGAKRFMGEVSEEEEARLTAALDDAHRGMSEREERKAEELVQMFKGLGLL